MARVTIDDLAARLGLSRASVSYALNGRPGVGEETRSRVTALATELGWQPSVSARSLSLRRADAYGIVLNRRPEDLGSEPFYMGLLSGIESALSDAGISLMIRFVPDVEAEAAVYRTWSAEGRVDAVLLTDLRTDDPRPALLDELSLTFLVHAGRLDHHRWVFDQADDAAIMVNHLAQLGHRRIAHVSGPTTLVHEIERRDAIRRYASEHGMQAIAVEGDYTFDGSAELTAGLMQRTDPPSAIIYSNDLMAVGGSIALRACHRRIGVISWDDSLLCQAAAPSISALQRNPYGAGRLSAERLINRVEHVRHPVSAHVASTLVVRDSSLPHP